MMVLGITVASCGKDRDKVVREKTLASETISSIGVNAYLWQASLNTLDFLPMAQADPNGGVIISDWRTDPANPARRVKVTVYIQDKALQASSLKVSVFQQELRQGQWADLPTDMSAEHSVEDAILIEARRLRMQQMPGRK
jgi:hypothetical protein